MPSPFRRRKGGDGEHSQGLLEEIEHVLGGADPAAPAAPRGDSDGAAEEERAAGDAEGSAPEHHRRRSSTKDN